jgi:hypothetical protein
LQEKNKNKENKIKKGKTVEGSWTPSADTIRP